ncbi:MAG: hypothetical protein MJZ16_10420 [Bacteroidales bacterium]|nr:hypothetical protein [Bacteroidales bacterium]
MGSKSKLEIAQEKVQDAINRTNHSIEYLGEFSSDLQLALQSIQAKFDEIRNVPSDTTITYNKIKEQRLNWKAQVERIEKEYEEAAGKAKKSAVTGALAGIGVGALGPTAAMGVATTFGVASTGTAISTLSGAAATNAAIAWLGGGAIAAGGGGIAAGEALLAMAGPIGWAIAGVALVASGLFYWSTRTDKEQLEKVFTLISERDARSYDLATVEINERVDRIKIETAKLREAIGIISTFGTKYTAMTSDQQYTLGAFVNLMKSATQLLVNPILGLQPKFTKDDMEYFSSQVCVYRQQREIYPDVIIYFANLLYRIDVDDNDVRLLCNSFRKNEKMLKSINLTSDEINIEFLQAAKLALWYKYRRE